MPIQSFHTGQTLCRMQVAIQMGARVKKRPGYIFTNKTHSNKAIMSTILGVISIMALGSVLYLAYVQKGNAPISYGLTGLLIMLFSLTGFIMGITTALEKDRYKLFPGLGICFNLIALAGIAFVVYAGMSL